jgi:hypothetical protein
MKRAACIFLTLVLTLTTFLLADDPDWDSLPSSVRQAKRLYDRRLERLTEQYDEDVEDFREEQRESLCRLDDTFEESAEELAAPLLEALDDAKDQAAATGELDLAIELRDARAAVLADALAQLPEFPESLGWLEFSAEERDHVTIPHTLSLDLSTACTIELWVRVDSPGESTWHRLLNKGDGRDCTSEREYEISLGTSEEGEVECIDVNFFTGTGNGWVSYRQQIDFETGEWYHIAVTYDATNGRSDLYVGGERVGGTNRTANGNQILLPIKNTAQPLLLGAGPLQYSRPDEGYLLHNGALGEVRIWSVARTADEIAASWNRSVPVDSEALVGYWQFNEADGQTIIDASPSANHGCLGSSARQERSDPERHPSEIQEVTIGWESFPPFVIEAKEAFDEVASELIEEYQADRTELQELYAEELAELADSYRDDSLALATRLIEVLDAAQTRAIQRDDLDLAVDIRDAIEEIQAQYPELLAEATAASGDTQD